ncbi:hypothetical protein G4228_000022, partial [Cervus hanglu yarkandensis]
DCEPGDGSEKQKKVIEGYRMNEESLRILHRQGQGGGPGAEGLGEERLQQANEEMAQVWTDALQLQVVLRKEQMRVSSLEKVVEQETKENDKLPRICDDLISKMERI